MSLPLQHGPSVRVGRLAGGALLVVVALLGSITYLQSGGVGVGVARDAALITGETSSVSVAIEAPPCIVPRRHWANTTMTVVTAYYSGKSKYTTTKYDTWIQNFLMLRTNVYLFTDQLTLDASLASLIAKSGKKNICIHLLNKSDFGVNKLGINWTAQHVIDSEKAYHNTDLYMLWGEKLNFVKAASEHNPYESSWFGWVDMGSFRGEFKPFFRTFPTTNLFEKDKIHVNLVGVLGNFTIDTNSSLPQPMLTQDLVGGGFLFGDMHAFSVFHDLFYDYMVRYARLGQFVGKDQIIFNTCYAMRPSLFVGIRAPPKEEKWFWPQYYYSFYG